MNEPSNIGNAPVIAEAQNESNLVLGLVGGVISMLVSASLWGFFTFITNSQIGWMAIGVGFLVGFAIKKLGKGNTLIFGISGAVLSLLGCALGNFFFYNSVLANEWGVSFFDVLIGFFLQPEAVLEIFILAFKIIDLLFYGLAVYFGFRVAMSHSKSSTPTKHWSETK